MNTSFDWKSLPVIILLLTNMCGGVWYASALEARVSTLEQKITVISADHELLVRMDERIRSMAVDVADLKHKWGARR